MTSTYSLGLILSLSLCVCVWSQTDALLWRSDAPPFESVSHPLKPTERWGNFSTPLPTGSFFTNLALGDGSYPIDPYPYMTKMDSNSLQICYPKRTPTSAYIIQSFLKNMEVSAVETLGDSKIVAFDSLSVTLSWPKSEGSGSMTVPIVRGAPFVTAIFQNLTPTFTSQHAILKLNGGSDKTQSGSKFQIEFNNGQKWALFVLGTDNDEKDITLTWESDTLTASGPFTGAIRVALMVSDEAEEVLTAHSKTIPMGAKVSQTYSQDSANITFEWEVLGNPEDLVVLALPHHMESLVSSNEKVLQGVFRCLKGPMVGIVGSSWELSERLTPIEWSSDLDNVNDEEHEAIVEAIRGDMTRVNPDNMGPPDPYFGGKSLATLARLTLIAEDMEEFNASKTFLTQLKRQMDPWLSASNSNPLVYDSTWGGICSTNGIRDSGADFGNGWYNDHHFHYGYFVYASAVIAKYDPEWVSDRFEAVMALVNDIATPTSTDAHFPLVRHKDWYDGHSWASGLFPFGDAKNQESSSEAVNGYYGIYLLGKAMGNNALRDFGRLLLATEIRSVHRYWHIYDKSDIYDEVFAANKVVGVLWASKVDYATFFGNQVELIHCIQMLPFTPITEELLPSDWIEEEFPVLAASLDRQDDPMGDGWKGYVFMAQGIINPSEAWENVKTLKGFDGGNTKSNTLYWIATRPQKKE